MINPEITCKRCELRVIYGKRINDENTNWCPDCDDCERIPTISQYRDYAKYMYLSDKCIGSNGMSGFPELKFLPSQVMSEDAGLMDIVDFVFEERVRIFVERDKARKTAEKVQEEINETKTTEPKGIRRPR